MLLPEKMKKSRQAHFLESPSSKNLPRSPDSDLPPTRQNSRNPPRRKIRNRTFSGAKIASRKVGVSQKSRPATPFSRWKFDDGDFPVDDGSVSESGVKNPQKVRGDGEASVSARKLAAGLWHLQLPEVSGSKRRKSTSDQLGLEPVAGHVGVPYHSNPYSVEHNSVAKHQLQNSISVSNQKNGILYKPEPTVILPNSSMEGFTKWDPGTSKRPGNVFRFNAHLKHQENQQASPSIVSALQSELEQAQTHVSELETERRTSKKKLDHFLQKLSDERAAWRSREHEKIRAIIDNIKDDLNRERKNRQRMELVNSKLVNDLAKARLSAKRFLQEYEKERKARELMEEVCDELAKEMGEDKAEVEAFKRESMKLQEEMEDERKMLQMAEVWREERVQMKLIEAKLILEDKYSHLSRLIVELDNFLRLRNPTAEDEEIREAKLIREAASSVNIQDIKEFSYQPPSSEDIFPAFEDLQLEDENDREIKPSFGFNSASRASKVHTVSPQDDEFNNKTVQRYHNGCIDRDGDMDDDDGSGWETVSQVEEQGSCISPEGSYPSVNGHHEQSIVSESGTEWEGNGDNGTANTKISDVYSALMKSSRKKASSISRLWKSGTPDGDICKTISVEVINGRLSNGFLSPDGRLGEVSNSPPSAGQWSSPESANIYIARGMKGCIEWPKGVQKNNLKSKLFEARMEGQKVQLRHALKQKI